LTETHHRHAVEPKFLAELAFRKIRLPANFAGHLVLRVAGGQLAGSTYIDAADHAGQLNRPHWRAEPEIRSIPRKTSRSWVSPDPVTKSAGRRRPHLGDDVDAAAEVRIAGKEVGQRE